MSSESRAGRPGRRPIAPPAEAKQPVNAALAGPYGHPWHPLLVTVPIGAWVASLVFDVGSFVVPAAGFLVAGSRWLIALGVLGGLAAALVGALDLLAIPPHTPARRTAVAHMVLNLVVVAAYVTGFLWRRGTEGASTVGAGQLALSVVAVALLAVSGSLGGRLVFRFGVRVADERTQVTGYRDVRDEVGEETA
ncbi:DUF2231 domain-containing protein [Actinomycetospora chlora]|uniref:DUF2231 domain-containing protein n=1 Tax=Actinomycetospora chlora TaxID=663608 RepID=UPI0031EE8D86